MPIPLNDSDPQPSASWSTQDTILDYDSQCSAGVVAEKVISVSMEAIALSTLEPVTQVYWHTASIFKVHSSWVKGVTFSPDGKQIAFGLGGKPVRLWNSATGELRNTLKGHSEPVRAVTFLPDGKQIKSVSSAMMVKLWNSATGELRNTLEGSGTQPRGSRAIPSKAI